MDDTRKLYPDLIEAGGLAQCLQREFEKGGSRLHVGTLGELFAPRREFPAYARVEQDGRSSQIYIAVEHRMFVFDFWNRGVMLADASTPDITAVARSIHRWIVDRISTSQLHEEFPFVAPEESAQAFEAGNEVEWRWAEYEQSIPKENPELVDFFEVARRTPELRQLFPFTSLFTFCFSRCTGYPYTRDCPAVVPKADPRGRDFIPNRYIVVLGNREIGEGDGAEAVHLVIENLPRNCGPASAGTADDLAGKK